MIVLFWVSLAMLVYTYFGYPAYVIFRANLKRNNVKKDLDFKPSVSVILSAYNEEAFIEHKIRNMLESEYPKEKTEILIGSDGSIDRTNSILSKINDKLVNVSIFEKRRGKISVINELVSKASGDILVFCDIRQTFDKYAIANLVADFADEKVGCVSGELVFKSNISHNGIAEGVGLYWDYEKLIRKGESAIHSMVGATGAIYAVRRELYSPPPANTILDDVFIPLSVVRKGYRSIWDPEAKAYDAPASTPDEEYKRKVRTLAGNYQIFAMFKDLLIPFRSAASMPLLSHKMARVLAPFFMIALVISNLFIARREFYGALLICQALFYVLAFLGSITYENNAKRLITRIASVAYMFCLMNFTALAGFYRYAFGKQNITWEK